MITRKDIEDLDRKIKLLKQEREDDLTKMQDECMHPIDEWLETPYRDGGHYGYSSGEIRVCKLCGYAEDGWGCGFWKLKKYTEIPKISREKAFKDYILKLYTQQDLSKLRYPNRGQYA